ncbi:amidohydrolase family protein [Gilvimarinus sp. 1_MG-2023]|uniref:amidohydrolase family protein n=1 Tax=Gilvimarinus sp. 1_MG-2023 TaxID=3062638 RepID=UPI0026E116BB|nr:amidohydrolase family protein [Gilvimarinus sp. 1_MG-2023]MDO6746723.1 amidohydrolase family protein [Gilvimarinus sp. 1_MG-2023]
MKSEYESLFCIDSHQHFWRRSRGDYTWLTPNLGAIYADFMPEQLRDTLSRNGIDQTVLVQAAETDSETDFMLSIADATPFVAGVVGWVALEQVSAKQRLLDLSKRPKFKGIRPMLQAIDNVDWMLLPELDCHYKVLTELGLCFDALITPVHLPNVKILAERYPELKIVIDHAAKPDLTQTDLTQWQRDLAAVAKCSNVYCKLSGLLNEAGSQPRFSSVVPAIDHVLQCFGPKRVMWGSDWPVIRLAGHYDSWVRDCRSYLSSLSVDDQAWVWGRSAQQFYSL